jgi:hypothetical protein
MEFDKYSISVFSDPALTLGGHGDVFAELVPCAHDIVARGFGGDMLTRTPEKIRVRLLSADALAILDDGDRVVGFATSDDYLDYKTFYLDGVVILPEVKRCGIPLIQALMDGSNLQQIACTTQNPIVFCLLRSICATVSPSPEKPNAPAHLRQIASQIMRDQKGDAGALDPTTFVIRDLYETCRYRAIPASRDERVNRWFADALNIHGGRTRDGFFFVGEGFLTASS